jgi:hypothetical protein
MSVDGLPVALCRSRRLAMTTARSYIRPFLATVLLLSTPMAHASKRDVKPAPKTQKKAAAGNTKGGKKGQNAKSLIKTPKPPKIETLKGKQLTLDFKPAAKGKGGKASIKEQLEAAKETPKVEAAPVEATKAPEAVHVAGADPIKAPEVESMVKASNEALHQEPALASAEAPAPQKRGLLGWLKGQFTMREDVKTVVNDAKAARAQGKLYQASAILADGRVGVAARREITAKNPQSEAEYQAIGEAALKEVADSPKLGLREKLTLWNADRKQNAAAVAGIRSQSKIGDTIGAKDAIDAAAVMKESGKMSGLRAWDANRARIGGFLARRNAVRNAIKFAKKVGKKGGLEDASTNIAFAQKEAGFADKRVSTGYRQYIKNADRAIERAAKDGNPEATLAAINEARNAPGRAAGSFDEARAVQFEELAYQNQLPKLLAAAKADLKSSKVINGQSGLDRATYKFGEALELQQRTGIEPSGRAARTEAKLMKKLGARVDALNEQLARQAEAAGTPAEGPAPEAVAPVPPAAQ